MCGKEGCTICARIKQKVRTKNVEVNGYNICQYILRCMDLPVPNPKDQEHFLALYEPIQYIKTLYILFERLKQVMPNAKTDTDKKKSIKQSKDLGKGKQIVATKVWETVECDTCGVVHFIYSYHEVEEKKGPNKKQLKDLVKSLSNLYDCGNSINNNAGFYVKRQLRCGDYIGSKYYNPKSDVNGNRIVTNAICAI